MHNVLLEIQKSFLALLQSFKQELQSVRTNRPQAALIEDVRVLYYGEMVPLKTLGSISVHPPRELACHIYDVTALPQAQKALEELGAGLSVSQDGSKLRIFLPELTSERKEEMVKFSKRLAEERRIEIRHLRDEANKNLQSLTENGEIREDDKFKIKDSIQKEVEKINEEIEDLLLLKESEIRS